MVATAYPNIVLLETGMPALKRIRFKLQYLVEAFVACEENMATMLDNYPQLTTAEVHEAMAYYYAHKSDLDEFFDQRNREAEEILRTLPRLPETVRAKIEAAKQARILQTNA